MFLFMVCLTGPGKSGEDWSGHYAHLKFTVLKRQDDNILWFVCQLSVLEMLNVCPNNDAAINSPIN